MDWNNVSYTWTSSLVTLGTFMPNHPSEFSTLSPVCWYHVLTKGCSSCQTAPYHSWNKTMWSSFKVNHDPDLAYFSHSIQTLTYMHTLDMYIFSFTVIFPIFLEQTDCNSQRYKNWQDWYLPYLHVSNHFWLVYRLVETFMISILRKITDWTN